MNHAAMEAVLAEVAAERERQHARWGQQDLPDGTPEEGEIDREIADFAREVCQQAVADGTVTFRHIANEEFFEACAESDPVRLRAELIQAAAVLVQWVEAIDRRKP